MAFNVKVMKGNEASKQHERISDGWDTRARIIPEPANLELDILCLYQGQVSKTYIEFMHIRDGRIDGRADNYSYWK